MSLIERAAKRLEELQRTGAALPDTASDRALVSESRVPTPEALVQEIAARKAHGGSAAPLVRPAAVNDRSRVERESPADARPPRRYVEIDFGRLAQLGYVTPENPQAQIAQEFRVLKRPLLRNAQGRTGTRIANGNLVMVTSSVPGEGKTFTAANLAISMAMEFDHSVMLVDGDVAHPTLPSVLETPPAPGLLDLLVHEDLDISDVLLQTNMDKLTVLPAGTRQPNATELLASDRMASLLRDLAARYPARILLFDSPPLLATTEARVLATHMGQIVMAVAADSTSKNTLKQALATIERCEVVLMMLNKATGTEVAPYGYYRNDDQHP